MNRPKKIGRPISDNPKTKNVTVRFTTEEAERFDEYVSRNNTTKSNLIREFVLGVLEEQKK